MIQIVPSIGGRKLKNIGLIVFKALHKESLFGYKDNSAFYYRIGITFFSKMDVHELRFRLVV